jgi:hypothetical protein
MPVLEFYYETRKKYSAITEEADREHMRNWHSFDPEFAYSWFESLANALNNEMSRGVTSKQYAGLFRHMSSWSVEASQRQLPLPGARALAPLPGRPGQCAASQRRGG